MKTNMEDVSEPRTGMRGMISVWEEKHKQHREKQLINPFSGWEGATHRTKLSKSDKDYGKPVAGSKTEFRGERANMLISSEIEQLLLVIYRHGNMELSTNRTCITFGKLFELYTHISNKVVGLLLRARKYQLIDFTGEMLFQRRDEATIIYLEHNTEDLCRAKYENKSSTT